MDGQGRPVEMVTLEQGLEGGEGTSPVEIGQQEQHSGQKEQQVQRP